MICFFMLYVVCPCKLAEAANVAFELEQVIFYSFWINAEATTNLWNRHNYYINLDIIIMIIKFNLDKSRAKKI